MAAFIELLLCDFWARLCGGSAGPSSSNILYYHTVCAIPARHLREVACRGKLRRNFDWRNFRGRGTRARKEDAAFIAVDAPPFGRRRDHCQCSFVARAEQDEVV